MDIDYLIFLLAIYIKLGHFKIKYIQTICISTKSIINIIIIKETTFTLNNKFNPLKNGYNVSRMC